MAAAGVYQIGTPNGGECWSSEIPNMKSKNARWGLGVMLAALVVVALLLPPWSKPKSRASRVEPENRVWSVSISMPITNGLSAVTNGK
jgi:hypothetical protein